MNPKKNRVTVKAKDFAEVKKIEVL